MRRITAFWSGLFVVGAVLVQVAPVSAEPVGGDFTGDSVVLVVDVSGSMSGTPLSQAKDALHATVASLDDGVAVGLRSYAGSCGNGGTNLVPVGLGNRAELDAAVDALNAGGGTPTPDALRAAVGDLPQQGQRTIVLVSDGNSTCGAVCPVASELAASEAVDFSVFTVGFNAPASAAADLTCVADATGGTYVQATDTETLIDAIGGAVGGARFQAYVALGDSFSSGEGAYPYLPGTTDVKNGCHRSEFAWPSQLATVSPLVASVDNKACTGARTGNLVDGWEKDPVSQLDYITAETDLITVTIGGNDAKFGRTVAECFGLRNGEFSVKNGFRGSCVASGTKYFRNIQNAAKKIERTLARIVDRAEAVGSEARIIAVSYPKFFPSSPSSDLCDDINFGGFDINEDEQVMLNNLTSDLDALIHMAADNASVEFVSPLRAFEGHELCAGPETYLWGVGPALPTSPDDAYDGYASVAFHPNLSGYRAMANEVSEYLDSTTP